MPRKNIGQLDSIAGSDLANDDLVHPWDDANSINKKMRLRNMLASGRFLRRKPTLDDFPGATWTNQDGTVLTEVTAGLLFDNHSGTGGEQLSSFTFEAPTTPYSIEIGVILKNTTDYSQMGIVVGMDDGTNLVVAGPLSTGYAPNINTRYMSDHNTYAALEVISYPFSYSEHFVKFEDTGTVVNYYISPDLENWFLYASHNKADLFGGWAPNVIGFGGWHFFSIYTQGLITHWKLNSGDEDISMLLWGDDDDGITFDGSDYIVYE